MNNDVVCALAVSGLDPSGGAGLLADVRTFHQFGVYPAGVAATLTVQDTSRVIANHPVDAETVRHQLESLMSDMTFSAAKVGALGSASVVQVVAAAMANARFPWVVDPVMLPTSGAALLQDDAQRIFRSAIVPRAELLTPNANELGLLSDCAVPTSKEDAVTCARRLISAGARAVLATGGHFNGEHKGTDVLVTADKQVTFPVVARFDGEIHGTGCALSSAIAAQLALGTPLVDAIGAAKRWLELACANPACVGKGQVTANHHARSEIEE